MGRALRRRLVVVGQDAGMTTAEYAVGTVAACGLGGVLIKLLSSDTVMQILLEVIKKAFAFLF